MDHADYALFWPRTAAEMRRASPALLYLRRNQRSPARYAPHGSYRRLRISLPSRSAPLTGRPRYAAHIARPRVIARACDSTAPGPRRQSCFSGTDLLHLASAQSTTRRGPGTPSLARTPNSRGASEAHPRLERLVFRADLSLASLVRGLLTRCQRGSPGAARRPIVFLTEMPRCVDATASPYPACAPSRISRTRPMLTPPSRFSPTTRRPAFGYPLALRLLSADSIRTARPRQRLPGGPAIGYLHWASPTLLQSGAMRPVGSVAQIHRAHCLPYPSASVRTGYACACRVGTDL